MDRNKSRLIVDLRDTINTTVVNVTETATVMPLVGFEMTDGIRKINSSNIIQYLISEDNGLRWINVLHADNIANIKSSAYSRK